MGNSSILTNPFQQNDDRSMVSLVPITQSSTQFDSKEISLEHMEQSF